MTKTIYRKFELTPAEVRQAVHNYLDGKGHPVPPYVGNAGTTKWGHLPKGGVIVEWTEQEELE